MKNRLLEIACTSGMNFKREISVFCAAAIALIMTTAGCTKYDTNANADGSDPTNQEAARAIRPITSYDVINLVSDTEEYKPSVIDPNLVNAWGIAFSPTGGIWISAADTGVSVIYDQAGKTLRAPVTIPDASGTGNPTGQVFNPTSTFLIPATGQVSRFIFATENGTIAAWASGDKAIIVADRSADHAVYKGIEMVNVSGTTRLYATDFHNAKIDIFDDKFNFIGNKDFNDSSIPDGYAPFNIRKIGDRLFVTYAKQLGPDNDDDEAGLGNGYVNVFDIKGALMQKFAMQGTLNSPWGIERLKPDNRAGLAVDLRPETEVILIGNFGDGHINAFNGNGKFIGQLKHNNEPLEIEGLWAISYRPAGNKTYLKTRNQIFFTAAPDEESHGVFGYIIGVTNNK